MRCWSLRNLTLLSKRNSFSLRQIQSECENSGKLSGDIQQAGENTVESVSAALSQFFGLPLVQQSEPSGPPFRCARLFFAPDVLTELPFTP
jgi:hypothetical protein